MIARLRTPALHSMAGGILQKAIPFLASIYVARAIGPQEYAVFAFSINTANTITALSALGLAPAILTSLSGRRPGPDLDNKINGIFLFSGLICLVSALFGSFFGFFELTAIRNTPDLMAVIILSPGLILLQTVQSTYQGTGRHLAFLNQSVVLAVTVALSLLITEIVMASAFAMIFGYSLAFLGVAIASSIILLRNVRGKLSESFRRARSDLRAIIRAQLPFAGYTAVWMLAIYLCNLRIASDFTVIDLAYYNVGFQWYSLMLLVPATLGGVLIPHFATRGATAGHTRQRIRLVLLFAAVACPLTLSMYLFAPALLGLYGLQATSESLSTVRHLILAGGIAFTLTPVLQELMALRRFPILIAVSATWSAVALTRAYFFATNSADVAEGFLLGYCASTALVLAYALIVRIRAGK